MMVEYGIRSSIQESFYFITVTYKAGTPDSQRDAQSVRRDWRDLCLWLRPLYPNLKWIKVVELTRRNQPHLHVVLSFGPGTNPEAACEKKARYDDAWRRKLCECVEHAWSRAWWRITGDSFVIDCRPVVSGTSDAAYLGKYLAKSYLHKDGLAALGFQRTWSRSRSWGVDRLRFRETEEKEWRKTEFTYGMVSADPQRTARYWIKRTEESNPFERLGTDLNWEMEKERDVKAGQSRALGVKELVNASH